MNHSTLFRQIEELIPALGGWSSPLKCCEFASIVLASRPIATVEIGTHCGRAAFALALAHRFVARGKVHVVEPWSGAVAKEGNETVDADWWGDQAKHDWARDQFMSTQKRLEIAPYIDVQQTTSDLAKVPEQIGFLLVDGNHGEQSIRDVQRWAPKVTRSGYVYMDDLNWKGGAVQEAERILIKMGFVPLWHRDEGAFYQRS